MLRDDAADNREAEAAAAPLRRIVRHEQLVTIARRHARAVIGDDHAREAPIGIVLRLDRDPPFPIHGFERVVDQVDQNAPDLLGIDANGAFYLNTRPIEAATLEDQLRSIYTARTKDKILYFKADQNIRYAKVQEAVEIARRAGVRVMSAITEREQTGGLLGGGGEEE